MTNIAMIELVEKAAKHDDISIVVVFYYHQKGDRSAASRAEEKAIKSSYHSVPWILQLSGN